MLPTQNLCPGTKMFLTSGKSIFCFRAAKFVSAAYHVSRAAKLDNMYVHNNVLQQLFLSLARPLVNIKAVATKQS